LLGDEAELFQSFHRRLTRIVQHLVNTSPDIVDDACNYAWMEFIRHQPDRDGAWKAWLVTTAQREAWKLDAKERAHTGFEVDVRDDVLTREPADPRDVIAIRSELRFALDVFATVPERRREAKAMFVTGLRYTEIQERLGLTYTRVNHLIGEANKAVQSERHRAARLDLAGPPRVRCLRHLESNPPAWLTTAIGRPPSVHRSAEALLLWRRAALVIDHYRREHPEHLKGEPLGSRPTDPRAARAYDVVDRAITRAREARLPPSRRRSLHAQGRERLGPT
jgi:DNA-directed RNA polymerase specialized sigma24 family protein